MLINNKMNRIEHHTDNDSNISNIMNTIRLTGIHYLLVSVILLPISIYCNHVFLQAQFFHAQLVEGDPGFTNMQWFHLLIATYAYPIGYNNNNSNYYNFYQLLLTIILLLLRLMTLIIFMIYAYKGRWPRLGKLVLFHVLFWVSVYCTYRSHYMAHRYSYLILLLLLLLLLL